MLLIFHSGRSVRLARYRYFPEIGRSVRVHIATLPRNTTEFPLGSEAWSTDERDQFSREILEPNISASRALPKVPMLLEAAIAELAGGNAGVTDIAAALAAARSLINSVASRGAP